MERGKEALDVVYSVLFEPGRGFARLAALSRPPVLAGALSVILVQVASASGLVAGTRSLLILPAVLIGLALWYVLSALVHMTASLLGASGGAVTLLALFGLAQLPGILAAPVSLLSRSIPALGALGSVAIFAWVVALHVLAAKETYRISSGRALVFLALPIVAILTLFVVGVGVGVAALAPSLPEILGEMKDIHLPVR